MLRCESADAQVQRACKVNERLPSSPEHCPFLLALTGVRELLALHRLTSLCCRSLEPPEAAAAAAEALAGISGHPGSEGGLAAREQPSMAAGGAHAWGGGSSARDEAEPQHPHPLAMARCPWRRLSLGACRPSLAALAVLPLHSLTSPFPLCELDLGGHPAAVAAAVAAVSMQPPTVAAAGLQLSAGGTSSAGGGAGGWSGWGGSLYQSAGAPQTARGTDDSSRSSWAMQCLARAVRCGVAWCRGKQGMKPSE
jgi:hypothetical protein